ncbi:MAG: SBBP repeat-containing protein, partial [Actinomycetota bacterium]
SMGGPKPSVEGPEDAFVAKVNPSGSALVYSGFVGGTASDFASDIAIDSAGAVYISGQSNSATITGAPAGPDPSGNGGEDGFVAKVSPDGSALVYGGFIGGTDNDDARDVAVDPSGRAYVVGQTQSSSGFPAVIGPDLSLGGSMDGYVARINPAGTGFDFAGYVGGASQDFLRGVALAPNDVLYVGGGSSSGQFAPPGRKALGVPSSSDAFVATVPTSGAAVTSLRLIGGSDGDAASAIALDGAANAYLVGETQSTLGFPAVVGPDLDYNGDPVDGFVAKMQTLERCKGRPVTRLGSNTKDQIVGTGKADVVLAEGGNDRVTSKGGNDRVCGGKGNDRVKAGGGKDLVLGQGGRDNLNGGAGKVDKCVGGAGKDAGKNCERGKV